MGGKARILPGTFSGDKTLVSQPTVYQGARENKGTGYALYGVFIIIFCVF